MTKATKQLSKANRPAQHGPYRCDRPQMPNTINATNPMPTNSTTSATESYSSQCRLRESIGAAHPLNVQPQPPVASLTAQLRQLLFFGQKAHVLRPGAGLCPSEV